MSIVAKRLDGSRWHLALSGPWSRPHCARWGPSFPPQDVGESPQFSADFYCGQAAGCIKMPLGTEVGSSPGNSVLDADPSSLSKKGRTPPPPFSAHVCCGQTAAWIKIPLGTEVGLVPSDFVFDEDSAPTSPEERHTHLSTNFGPCLLWPNGWMDQDATWYGS